MIHDLLIIGGGVNGTGIARDAAGRGLNVALCEMGDFAQGTSSKSSKLVHGGLRYLEYYEFRLVREALIEREVLLASAPHIIWPLRFLLPHSPEQRPAWMVRLGLFLYDHLGGRKVLPASRGLRLDSVPEGAVLKPQFQRGFEYSDCWVDDARLVVLNALDAAQRGARIMPRTKLSAARREGGRWLAELVAEDGTPFTLEAKALVNAAGPWVDEVQGRGLGQDEGPLVRRVKGSHIIVPKFFVGERAFILQNDDKRVIFIIPYEGDLALIGTTDITLEAHQEASAISDEETAYLLRAVNRYLLKPLARSDIRASYAGVRPLHEDHAASASAVSRDYVLDVKTQDGAVPVLSVFGGKITTFRRLAEHALAQLQPWFPQMTAPWTGNAHLPGGDMAGADFAEFVQKLTALYPWLPTGMTLHFARLYGTRAPSLLGAASSMDDLGRHFGGTLYESEIRFLVAEEWARTGEDVLERRTKHYLRLSADEQAAVGAFVAGLVKARG